MKGRRQRMVALLPFHDAAGAGGCGSTERSKDQATLRHSR